MVFHTPILVRTAKDIIRSVALLEVAILPKKLWRSLKWNAQKPMFQIISGTVFKFINSLIPITPTNKRWKEHGYPHPTRKVIVVTAQRAYRVVCSKKILRSSIIQNQQNL